MPKDEIVEAEKEEYLPGGQPRCMAVNDDGEQCRRKAQEGSKYCWQHAPDSEFSHQMVKFDAEKKRQVIRALERFKALSLSGAAGRVGVSENTVRDRLDPESPRFDEKFAKELEVARKAALGKIEESLYSVITGDWKKEEDRGKPDMSAIQFALINMTRSGEKYIFPKATKNAIPNEGEDEDEDYTHEQARSELADLLGTDKESLDDALEGLGDYVDVEEEGS